MIEIISNRKPINNSLFVEVKAKIKYFLFFMPRKENKMVKTKQKEKLFIEGKV